MPVCKHLFHNKCILYWLQTNCSCPNCRNDIRAALRLIQVPRTDEMSIGDRYLNRIMENLEPSFASDELNF